MRYDKTLSRTKSDKVLWRFTTTFHSAPYEHASSKHKNRPMRHKEIQRIQSDPQPPTPSPQPQPPAPSPNPQPRLLR